MGKRLLVAIGLAGTGLAACGGGSSAGGSPSPSGAPASSPVPPSVSMTIADHQTLAHAVAWEVMVKTSGTDVVDHVDFLIDGKKQWEEQVPPFVFDDDHELLPPWLLGNGNHVLSAHVVTLDGASADAVAHVRVNTNLSPNKAVAGTYTRVVTHADQQRVMPYRIPSKGAFGEVSPSGKWRIVIKPNGEIFGTDPRGPSDGVFVEPYTVSGRTMRLYGAAVWRQPRLAQTDADKFCEPEAASDYVWTMSGSTLTIKNVQKACADRDIVFVGKWARTG